MHDRAAYLREKHGMRVTSDLLDNGAAELDLTKLRAEAWWAEFVRVNYECCKVCGGDAKALRDTFMRDTFWPDGR